MRARKSLGAWVLALSLVAPVASADTFGDLWGSFVRAVARAGSSMDPNGNDSRGTMDPDGGKSRGTMDPDGRGPYIDPNGG